MEVAEDTLPRGRAEGDTKPTLRVTTENLALSASVPVDTRTIANYKVGDTSVMVYRGEKVSTTTVYVRPRPYSAAYTETSYNSRPSALTAPNTTFNLSTDRSYSPPTGAGASVESAGKSGKTPALYSCIRTQGGRAPHMKKPTRKTLRTKNGRGQDNYN